MGVTSAHVYNPNILPKHASLPVPFQKCFTVSRGQINSHHLALEKGRKHCDREVVRKKKRELGRVQVLMMQGPSL